MTFVQFLASACVLLPAALLYVTVAKPATPYEKLNRLNAELRRLENVSGIEDAADFPKFTVKMKRLVATVNEIAKRGIEKIAGHVFMCDVEHLYLMMRLFLKGMKETGPMSKCMRRACRQALRRLKKWYPVDKMPSRRCRGLVESKQNGRRRDTRKPLGTIYCS